MSRLFRKMIMLPSDFEMLAKLHVKYARVLEDQQISKMAQLESLRQTSATAVAVMLVLLIVGTAIVVVTCDVSMSQALLYSIYTVTSAGFGNVPVPDTVGFLVFAIVYVYLGISALAINVAQVYQYLETEHSTWLYRRNKVALAKEGLRELQALKNDETRETNELDQRVQHGLEVALQNVTVPTKTWQWRRWQSGRISPALRVPLFLVTLLLVGAIGMVLLEGWTFIEALYFATFAMTTVGYGDITPTSNAGTWFVVFWLPFNVSFLALYLGTVAHYYVRVSQWNEKRIEQQLRNRTSHTPSTRSDAISAEMNAPTRDDVSGHNGTGSVQPPMVSGPDASVSNMLDVQNGTAEERLLRLFQPPSSNSQQSVVANSNPEEQSQKQTTDSKGSGSSLNSCKLSDGVSNRPVTSSSISGGIQGMEVSSRTRAEDEDKTRPALTIGQDSNTSVAGPTISGWTPIRFPTFAESQLDGFDDIVTVRDMMAFLKQVPEGKKKDDQQPSMKLHYLAAERLARIVVLVVKLPSMMEIKNNEFLLTIASLKDLAIKWMIPYGAREAFRVASFQTLLFMGEEDLVLRGMGAFLDMNPFHFNNLLGPVVLAMEGSVEEWLKSTEELASEFDTLGGISATSSDRVAERRLLKNQIEDYFPVNPGNAVLIQM